MGDLVISSENGQLGQRFDRSRVTAKTFDGDQRGERVRVGLGRWGIYLRGVRFQTLGIEFEGSKAPILKGWLHLATWCFNPILKSRANAFT